MRLEDPSGGTLLPSGVGALDCAWMRRDISRVIGAVPVQGESADPGAFLGINPRQSRTPALSESRDTEDHQMLDVHRHLLARPSAPSSARRICLLVHNGEGAHPTLWKYDLGNR